MKKTVIKGKGYKRILIITGAHGNEVTPIFCGFLLEESLTDYKQYFKTCTILHSINSEGIKKTVREIPENKKNDINRLFSSEETPDFENEIKTYIKNNDIIIDVHSSPDCLECILINQDEYANNYIEFAKEVDINYVLRYSETNTIKKYALDLGKTSFTVELNGVNQVDIQSAFKGTLLIHKIIDSQGAFDFSRKEYPIYEPYFEYKTHISGLFIPVCTVGSIINRGNKLGKIYNAENPTGIEVIYTEATSRKIICGSGNSYVSPENSIYFMQKIEEIVYE